MVSGLRIFVALLMVAALLAGCSGDIEMQKLSAEQLSDTKQRIHGVIVYQPALFVEMSAKTTLVIDGKARGSSADNPPACVPLRAEKVVALPDLNNPFRVTYKPGLFDSNTFGVTLRDGLLAAVNSNPAAPGGGIGSSVTSSLAALPPVPTPLGVPLAAPDAPFGPGFSAPMIEQIQARSNLPACNDGPVVVGYRRLQLP